MAKMSENQARKVCAALTPTSLAGVVVDLEPYASGSEAIFYRAALETLVALVGEDEARELMAAV